MRITSFKTATSRAGKYAACLILGIATVSQTARAAGAYATAVLANNPVAFWQLDETGDPSTGTLPAVDSSGNGYDGTYGFGAYNGSLGGLTSPQPPTYPGFAVNQGALYSFAIDTNSSVSLPPLNLGTNAVTIAMWIYPYGNQATRTGLLMNRNSGDAAGLGFGGTANASGMAALGYTWNNNNANTYNFNSGLYPLSFSWNFVALVIQSNSATIYLNYIDSSGKTNLLSAVNSIAHTAEAFSGGGTFLGSDVNQNANAFAANVFEGYISSASVLKTALTQNEVLSLFGAGVGVQGFSPALANQPLSTYVLSGSNSLVRFSATGIGGNTPISLKWQYNGTDVDTLPNSANFTGITSNVLTVLSASAAEAGTYRLKITNPYGTIYSSNATLRS